MPVPKPTRNLLLKFMYNVNDMMIKIMKSTRDIYVNTERAGQLSGVPWRPLSAIHWRNGGN